MHARTVTVLVAVSTVLPARLTSAQAVVRPMTVGDVTISGSLRTRGYSWTWFDGSANGEYTYPASLLRVGIHEPHDRAEWRAEFALPVVMNLPTTAVTAAPQGQLGLGAAYFAANDNRATTATLHALSLADAHGLWYSGGGAFQPTSFGYAGRPSSGYAGLATLSDISGDCEISGKVSFNAY